MNATLPRCVPDALVTMKSAALEALNGEIQQLVLSSYKVSSLRFLFIFLMNTKQCTDIYPARFELA